MPLDFGRLTQTGVQAAKRVGATATATITRPAGPPDPITGVVSGATLVQTVDVVQANARRQAMASSAHWVHARTILLCGATGLAFAPAVGDRVTFAGATGPITAIDAFAPAGTVVAYFLAVG